MDGSGEGLCGGEPSLGSFKNRITAKDSGVHICRQSIWKVEWGGSEVQSQPWLQWGAGGQAGLCEMLSLKNKGLPYDLARAFLSMEP